MSSDRELNVLWKHLRFVSILGIVMTFSVVIFFTIGYFLNSYLNLGSWIVIVFIFLGAGLGLFWAYRRIAAMLKELTAQEQKKANGESDSSVIDL